MHDKPCPACGYCPTCGRRSFGPQPIYPMVPWPQPYRPWNTGGNYPAPISWPHNTAGGVYSH